MDLTVKTTDYGVDAKDWLGSAHGVNTAEAITLDPTLMLAAFADGNVPSGVTLGRVTATGRYARYDNAATDGREVMVGHLLNRVKVTAGQNAGGALFWHGQVVESKLPTGHGLDAAGKADVAGRIHYV